MEKKYLKVGTYVPGTEEKGPVIQRDYYRQGWIFKDGEAFLSHADQVCYVPELSDGELRELSRRIREFGHKKQD